MNARLKKFFSYYKPYRTLLFVDLACAAIASTIALALPLIARYIVGEVIGSEVIGNATAQADAPAILRQIYSVGALMLGLLACYIVCDIFVNYQGHVMGAYMERDMRAELFEHYQKLSFGFYDDQRTGQLMSRIGNDLFSLSELYHHGPEDLLIAVVKFVGVFVILINIHVPLTLTLFLLLPFVAIYAFYFNRKMNMALRASKERIGDINAQVEETLSGIRVVQSFANEAVERAKFAQANHNFVESRRAGYRSETFFFEGLMAFAQLLTIIVIVLGGVSIVNASLTLADLLTYLLCVGILIEPIQRAVNFARLYQEGITGFDRFMEMLEIVPEIQDAPDAIELTQVRGAVEFRNVSFKYQQDACAPVLRNISLQIQAGEYVALVGASGVGKSTLCALIPRFYEVSAGEILLDGVNIKNITLQSLRKQIGVVQQDVYLFAGTVAENIRYGKLDATDAEIEAAARQANAHSFIMALPQGYQTEIGQRGIKLSGGQKQRLSIARVFLKDPPVILFDEATSALDNESERAVQESLERLTNNRTMLVIAHRLSTIRNAQRIIVLAEGEIVEQGTHAELVTRGGTYATLYNVQARI